MVKYIDKNLGFNQWAANKNTTAKPSKFTGFLWWFAIFVLVWWLASTWLFPKESNVVNVAQDKSSVETIDKQVPVSKVSSNQIAANVQGLRISKIELKDYTENKKQDATKKVVLLAGDQDFAEVGFLASGTTAPNADTIWRTDPLSGSNIMTWRNADKVGFKRTVTADNYIITVIDQITNNSGKDIAFAPYSRIVRGPGEKTATAVSTGAIAMVNSDVERDDWKDLEKKAFAYQTVQGFVGFADQYWETIVSVDSPDQTIRIKKMDSQFQADTSAAAVQIGAGKIATLETKIFAGPRDQNILNQAANSIAGLNQTMDYGWFWFLARPMLWALNALNGLVMNYGIAIILLTIGLRLLLWPLTRKSYTSMAAMQKMQPEMARIQKLYANDKPRLQMEMMNLYKTYKTSPMSGCVPMLVQIPIFFALYKALIISVPMRQASFLWISDLAVMDPYFILPIIMGATMWWQQHLQSGSANKNAAAPNDPMAQTQKVMKWMPILFTVMFAWMPAGLVLYWSVSNLFGIAQMYVIKRNMKK